VKVESSTNRFDFDRISEIAFESYHSHGIVYVAGPMTGLPEHNYPQFKRMATLLRERGFTVESPAERPDAQIDHDTDETEWHEWMHSALRQVLLCDMLVLLPGWEKSRGACAEVVIAHMLKMPVFVFGEFGTYVLTTVEFGL
jgi:nucleoside 2-deoxyribosyltransferase